MLLRGQFSRDQLSFDTEIKKIAWNHHRRKNRSKHGARREPSTSLHRDIQVNQEGNMAKRERAPPSPPPKRTLGNCACSKGQDISLVLVEQLL